MEADDEILLVVGDVAALDVWPEVVQPPQPAALAAPAQTCTTRAAARTHDQTDLLSWYTCMHGFQHEICYSKRLANLFYRLSGAPPSICLRHGP